MPQSYLSIYLSILNATTFVKTGVYIYILLLTGTIVVQAIIQVVMPVPNNNALPQRSKQSGPNDLPTSLEPRDPLI